MRSIILTIEGHKLKGTLCDTPVAHKLLDCLPLELTLNRWGDEYYGDIGNPLGSFAGEQVEVLDVGDLAYWEPGNALCLFFGPTPASLDQELRAASPVHKLGNVKGDWSKIKGLGNSVHAKLEVC